MLPPVEAVIFIAHGEFARGTELDKYPEDCRGFGQVPCLVSSMVTEPDCQVREFLPCWYYIQKCVTAWPESLTRVHFSACLTMRGATWASLTGPCADAGVTLSGYTVQMTYEAAQKIEVEFHELLSQQGTPADRAIEHILRYHDAVRSYERAKGTGEWTNQKWDLLSPAALYRLALTCVTKDGPQSPADWERAQSLPETGHPTMSVRRESWRNRA